MQAGPSSSRAWMLAIVCVVAALVSGWLGATYISRLPQHDGYFLVDVVDPVRVRPTTVPQRATLVVIDGLRGDAAAMMSVTERLRKAGQCRTADVGPYTVSRPIYSLLSTGLEVDRSGARNNDQIAPLFAESVWDVAAAAGLSVGVASHLPWWHQLFPTAFARTIELDEREDVFVAGTALATDITVIHPIYVDTVGHAFGAASTEYTAAVARTDREASAWLDGIDLQREIVVFAADHGHVDAGGHGAQQPEVRYVLVCMAGPGVAMLGTHFGSGDGTTIDARTLGPAIAVAMGLRFPRHMRAVDDDLDTLWSIFDGLPADYVADRQLSIETFRARNTEALAGWLGTDEAPSWAALASKQRRDRAWRIAVPLAFIAAGIGFTLRIRGLQRRDAALSLLWIVGTFAATCAVWTLVRGSFDYTSINERGPFIRASLLICGGVAVLAAWMHHRVFADAARWAGDQATLAFVVLALALAHVFAFGWPLGFPMPHRIALFFPFFASTLGVVHAVLAAIAALRMRHTV